MYTLACRVRDYVRFAVFVGFDSFVSIGLYRGLDRGVESLGFRIIGIMF